MVRLLIGGLIALISASRTHAGDELPLHGSTVFKLADIREAAAALNQRHRFIATLSPFDRQVRLKTDREVSEPELLQYMVDQVLPWDESDRPLLADLTASIRKQLQPWQLPLPPSILLVKTTGKEEAGAAYCRGAAIVLPRNKLGLARDRLQRLVTHELFHVLSNQNPDLRRDLYAIVGFKPCGEIALPESLARRRITNPDAYALDYFVAVTQDQATIQLTPLLFSKADVYDVKRGGELFAYLSFKLLQIERQADQWQAKIVDGQPVLLDPGSVSGYGEQIGRNTKYIIHPEEVLADNFVLLAHGEQNLPTPRIVDEMAKVLGRVRAASR